jgi:hypothetical protein
VYDRIEQDSDDDREDQRKEDLLSYEQYIYKGAKPHQKK